MKDTRPNTSGITFILPTSCGDDGKKGPKVASTKHKDVIDFWIQELFLDDLGEYLREKELKIR